MPSTKPILLLHLSDLHFGAANTWDSDPVLRGLAAYLKATRPACPDLVAITGDIAQSGSAADYALARDWIDGQLLPALGDPFPKDRVLLVPGNHDVDWTLVKESVQFTQDRLLQNADQDQIARLLQDPDEREPLLRRHRHWLAFAGAYGANPSDVPWWSALYPDVQGHRIHIAGLSSTWLSCARPNGEDDYGRLLLGRCQIHAVVCDPEAEGADLSIALVHHPWPFLALFDQQEAESLVRHHCRIVLRGHLHRQQPRLVHTPESGCLELAAGAGYAGSQWENAFQWVLIRPGEGRVEVRFHHWHENAWRPDYNVPGAAQGRAMFSLKPGSAGQARTAVPGIPPGYPAWLEQTYGSVELLGVEQQRGHAITLGHIYVPAVTSAPLEPPEAAGERPPSAPEKERLALVLAHLAQGSLYLPGDAGAGKSTFCRWVALLAAGRDPASLLPEPPEDYRETVPAGLRGYLPLLVPLRDFGAQLPCRPGVRQWTRAQLERALMDWLDRDRPGGLEGAQLGAHLQAGSALLLLDGMDEVPLGEASLGDQGGEARRYPRAALLSGLADALPAWTEAGNRVLLTSRPYGLAAPDLERLGLPRVVPLASLPEPLQTYFMQRWFHTLGRPQQAEGLRAHLAGRREGLGPLTRNPMLLTALCVIYGHGGRLPEDRYHLYERIVDNVLYNRYPGDNKEREPVLARLEAVALGMHTGEPAARRATPAAQVPYAEVERILEAFAARGWSPEQRRVRPALYRDELLTRSGLLLPKGDGKAAFYHLSFQEYLAAEAIAHRSLDRADLEAVLRQRAATLEWHPTLLFLFAGAVLRRWSLDWGVDFLRRLAGELTRERVAADPAPARLLAGALDLVLAKGQGLPEGLTSGYRRIALQALEDGVPIAAREPLARTLGRVGDPRISGMDQAGAWVAVPAGRFWMGAQKTEPDKPCYDPDAEPWGPRESPPHEVALDAYRIARHPVTVAQYAGFVEDNGYRDERWWSAGGFGRFSSPAGWEGQRRTPNCPVTGVCWYEAMAWCAWQDAQLRPSLAAGEALRLPTEAEWERAARGSDGRRWPWGDQTPDQERVNFRMQIGRPTPVGIYPRGATPDGIQDLAGNVWEWCLDEFDDKWYQKCQQSGVVNNPLGPPWASSRVVRGGSFRIAPEFLRCAIRIEFHPGGRYRYQGFRCALGPRRQP